MGHLAYIQVDMITELQGKIREVNLFDPGKTDKT